MLKTLFTLDYEIHGNGDGSPSALMVEPTDRMLRQFDRFGAKLTILADIAEILQFRRHWKESGRDEFAYQAIEKQLQDAIRRGHDVQLHIHSSYFNARRQSGRWIQDWDEYSFAGLSIERASEMIRIGKEYLEDLLQRVEPSYRCFVFRAANWSMCPSHNPIKALLSNGLTVDTSVFKYGRRNGLVDFDYGRASSNLIPWRASNEDICRSDPNGTLFEVPIYSENRWIGAFLTPSRIYRAVVSKLHRTSDNFPTSALPGHLDAEKKTKRRFPSIAAKHAWKADFNQCSGPQLIGALERAEAEYSRFSDAILPFVLIGHSKLFTRFNEWSLKPFLSFVENNSDRFGFARFADFDLQSLSKLQS